MRATEAVACGDPAPEYGVAPVDTFGCAFPLEVLVVWLLYVAVAVAMFVTYSRLPRSQLYHVSGTGFEGGASRVLVFANYSMALVAIPTAAIVADRLSRGLTALTALGAAAMAAAVFWPGVVDQADLDARPVNAIAAIGVLLALALTGFVMRRLRWGRVAQTQPGDRVRAVVAVVGVFVGLPWLAAELGFYLDGVPILGDVFQTGKLTWQSPTLHHLFPTVHHGHHHGLDGVLLLLTALLLSRIVPSVRLRPLRIGLGVYLALMVAYAIGNIANDAWDEQVVKRGWTDWLIPDVTQPKLSVAWGAIVAGTVILYASAVLWAKRPRQPAPHSAPIANG
jgi:hypothetical protein